MNGVRKGLSRGFLNLNKLFEKYSNKLKANQELWEAIVPTKSATLTDFYQGEHIERRCLDQSLSIIWDMVGRKGKKVRPALCMMLGDMYGLPEKVSSAVGIMVEAVHNCTLIIDDIEDKSLMRKGEPCTHLKYGIDNSINSGVLGFFLPFDQLMKSQLLENYSTETKLEMYKVFMEEMRNIHLGIGWDIGWFNTTFTKDSIPSLEDYYRMIESKTSVLIRIGFRLIGVLANCNETEQKKLIELANNIGKSYQIKDDLISLEQEDYKGPGTGIGEDITEGKITSIVINYTVSQNSDTILKVLSSKTNDQKIIREAIELMQAAGALDKAKDEQKKFTEEAIQTLNSLNNEKPNDIKQEMVQFLSGLLERTK